MAEPTRIYFGTRTHGSTSRGIYMAMLDSDTGALTTPTLAAAAENPTFLATSPDGGTLYSTISTTDGRLAAWHIAQPSGGLSLISSQSASLSNPTYISVDPAGHALFTISYGDACVASLPLTPKHEIQPPATVIQLSGHSVHPRQNQPHPHWIAQNPTNHFVYVPDLGTDRILRYTYNPADATLTTAGITTVPAGSGPRHMVFQGAHAYATFEISRKVATFYADPTTGELDLIAQNDADSTTQTTSDDRTSELNFTPNGRYLYVANRGQDTIAAFAINRPASYDVHHTYGVPRLIGRWPAGVRQPRHFNIDPTGHWLLAAGETSDNLALFKINDDGSLTDTGTRRPIPHPMCVLFTPITTGSE